MNHILEQDIEPVLTNLREAWQLDGLVLWGDVKLFLTHLLEGRNPGKGEVSRLNQAVHTFESHLLDLASNVLTAVGEIGHRHSMTNLHERVEETVEIAGVKADYLLIAFLGGFQDEAGFERLIGFLAADKR